MDDKVWSHLRIQIMKESGLEMLINQRTTGGGGERWEGKGVRWAAPSPFAEFHRNHLSSQRISPRGHKHITTFRLEIEERTKQKWSTRKPTLAGIVRSEWKAPPWDEADEIDDGVDGVTSRLCPANAAPIRRPSKRSGRPRRRGCTCWSRKSSWSFCC